jgi:hypothetical protein
MAAALYLVSCCKTKAPAAAAARDLYVSPWFAKARALAEARGADWRILSAEHGLVHPGQVLEPYETTLLRLGPAERLAWASRVWSQLLQLVRDDRPVVMLAGEIYREHLEPWLTAGGRRPEGCQVPMRGLGIGEQLAWLTRAIAQEEARA